MMENGYLYMLGIMTGLILVYLKYLVRRRAEHEAAAAPMVWGRDRAPSYVRPDLEEIIRRGQDRLKRKGT